MNRRVRIPLELEDRVEFGVLDPLSLSADLAEIPPRNLPSARVPRHASVPVRLGPEG